MKTSHQKNCGQQCPTNLRKLINFQSNTSPKILKNVSQESEIDYLAHLESLLEEDNAEYDDNQITEQMEIEEDAESDEIEIEIIDNDTACHTTSQSQSQTQSLSHLAKPQPINVKCKSHVI